ncbi:hypothetical protein BN946_scf184298.g32 [Trametes cinnabarina]|uniref:Uncharacterized protein n=1 Tax=Pycnoporus cinnabarinus TaxID=5643 RepID=A0A060SRJ6_PYCCI|nr:hypothetical protein BN946_scf184298.g32 [Trametes cinnabarina]
MSAPIESMPTCSIFVHPPDSPEFSTPPTVHYETFASLAEACGTRFPPGHFPEPGSPRPVQDAFQHHAVHNPPEQYLRPANWQLLQHAREYKAAKKSALLKRGRSLAVHWKVVSDPATGKLVVLPRHGPGSNWTPAAGAVVDPARKAFELEARLVPIYETALYVGLFCVYMGCTLLPLLF